MRLGADSSVDRPVARGAALAGRDRRGVLRLLVQRRLFYLDDVVDLG
jgi:hypothetical protein